MARPPSDRASVNLKLRVGPRANRTYGVSVSILIYTLLRDEVSHGHTKPELKPRRVSLLGLSLRIGDIATLLRRFADNPIDKRLFIHDGNF